MELRDMRAFVAVVEEGALSAAARRRTWAVWQATSHRQDLGRFVVALGSDSG
jgi:hypothetical protein